MNRRNYVKPQLKRVKLTIAEAVLTVCKAVGGTPKNGNCKTGTTGGCCKNTLGS